MYTGHVRDLRLRILLRIYLFFQIIPRYFSKQDKSSDIEKQPPFGDRKKKLFTASNEVGVTKPMGTLYNFDKV